MTQTASTTKNHKKVLATLKDAGPVILPSMLQCNFGNLEAEISKLGQANVQAIHLDVMDGHFVPNFTYGMPIAETFRKLTDSPIDVHLMIEEPARYAMQFVKAGADLITFHIEAVDDPTPLLQEIRSAGVASGLAINPSTPVERVLPYLSACDLLLVMSVEAGFGGQSFNATMLDRVRLVREMMGPEFMIEMDGGIGESTIRACVDAGTDLLVVGSAIFGKPDYSAAIARLSHLMTAAS